MWKTAFIKNYLIHSRILCPIWCSGYSSDGVWSIYFWTKSNTWELHIAIFSFLLIHIFSSFTHLMFYFNYTWKDPVDAVYYFFFILMFSPIFRRKRWKETFRKHMNIYWKSLIVFFFQFSSQKSAISTSSTYGSWLGVKLLLRCTWVYPQMLIIRCFLLPSKSFSITRGFTRQLYNLSLLRHVKWNHFLYLFCIIWNLKRHNESVANQ